MLTTEAEQMAFGARLVKALPAGSSVALRGDLGAGKTTLVRGALRGLGYAGPVPSPTYTLVETYTIAGRRFCHFDLYRLGDVEELEYIGFRDYFDGVGDCWVEWPERGEGLLPPADIRVAIRVVGTGRQLTCSATNAAVARALEEVA